jgi:RNA-directed DNA polymerase
MPQGAPLNNGAGDHTPPGHVARVAEMQAKLHRWAAADPGRRFEDLFNLVYDPATLYTAWDRVAGNQGANTPGIDGVKAADLSGMRLLGFLDDLRSSLKDGSFRPQPVRERKIPKPGGSGKVRALGIPTVADRVVQAALKLVLEPIFEADFKPVSYGFRPRRRAWDAIAEIHHFGTKGYRWVLDADITACFDEIEHTALMDRIRARIKDKRVLALVKAFLKAGILTELGGMKDTHAGTPQGGILSPLLANIALSALDEHFTAMWEDGGSMSTQKQRWKLRQAGAPTYRLVRYADDFVVMVHGSEADTLAVREHVAQIIAPIGLRLSQEKTRVVHMSEGFDFLGFRIQWRRKKGTTGKYYVYTFIADRPIRSVKQKIRDLTPRTSQQDLAMLIERVNQIMHGWAGYFKHAVAKDKFGSLDHFVWNRLIRLVMARRRWTWSQVKRWLKRPDGSWSKPHADGIYLRPIASVPVTRYRYRGQKIPNPYLPTANA